jgi:hypothetical protein
VRVTESDIRRIEETLGVVLPSDYRQFLLSDADEAQRIVRELPFRAPLWVNADEIICENQLARETSDVMTIGESEADEIPWPDRYVVVGTNGGGDYWFVHADGGERGLWFWQHESHSVTQNNPTFREYMEEIRRDVEDPERRRTYGG